jgi:lipopolysaccharide export system protein LptA
MNIKNEMVFNVIKFISGEISMNYFKMLTKYISSARFCLVFCFALFCLLSHAVAQEINLPKSSASEKIHVTADSLSSESNAKFAEFKGNVKVTQGNFTITSDSLKILYKEGGGEKKAGTAESIEKIIATGNVKIESEETTALSQQAEYDTNSMIMVLTGDDSRVLNKKNSVTGSKITFNRKEGVVKAEGDGKKRVSAVFFPDEKTAPGTGPEKEKPVYAAAVTQIASEKAKESDIRKLPESTVKSPTPEKSLSIIKEEKKPVVQAKADIPAQAGSQAKSPAPEKPIQITQEEKKPLVQAKADIKPKAENTPASSAAEKNPAVIKEEKPQVQAKAGIPTLSAPVNAVFVPSGVEKAKKVEPVMQKASYGTLIKSIGVSIIENKTGNSSIVFQDDINRQLSEALVRSCPGIKIFQPGDENFPADFIKPPRMASGSINGFRICETGRKLGLSAILSGSFMELKTGEEPRGILWYRDSHPFIGITVHLDIYDTETGAKLLDENFHYKRDSDELEIESAKAGKIEPLLLKEAFEHISKDAGRKICEIMKKQSWKGYVTSVSGGRISISSGSSKGISLGNTFEVYENRLLEGKDNQKFYIPGSKVSVIKITSVNKEDSEAILVAGDPVEAGYTLRAK